MATFITKDETGAIIAQADWMFPGSVEVTFDVVRGWDGKLYEAGGEPIKPAPTLEDQLAALKSSYDIKLAALDTSLQNALWVDGIQEEATRAALSAKRTALIRERSAAIKALTGK